MRILDDKRDNFSKDFEKYYLQRGFGSMNKNELEVLFFHLLKEYGDIGGKSVFELAREMKLPESKVKRLSYESDMIYGKQDMEEIHKRFLGLITDAKIQKEKGTLRFVIEDRYLRSTIYNDLKQNGYYLDSSFNSEIVSIQKEALVFLLDLYYNDEQKEEIVKKYKEARKKANKEESDISFRDVMKIVLDKVIENSIETTQEGFERIDCTLFFKTISEGAKAIWKIARIVACVAAII